MDTTSQEEIEELKRRFPNWHPPDPNQRLDEESVSDCPHCE
jgi:hypothetical protein